jgi:hypothetical protein
MSFDKLTEIERNTRFARNYSKLSAQQELLNQANDLVQDFTYADPNDSALRRVTSIVYSSASLGITVTETFTYTLSGAGDYYVTKIELS